MGVRINQAGERIKSISTLGPFVDETPRANAQKFRSPAETLAVAKEMHNKKLITDAEFERFKANPTSLPLWAEPNPTLFQTKSTALGGLAGLAGLVELAKFPISDLDVEAKDIKDIPGGFAAGVNGTLAGTAGAVQWLAGDTLVGKGARSLAGFLEENAEFVTPEDPSIVFDVSAGFGSMFTLLVPGAAVSKGLKAAQLIPRAVASFLEMGIFAVNESLVEAGSVYRERISQTGSRKEAERAARFVFYWNLPANAISTKFGLFAGKNKIIRSIIAEFFQESFQSVISQIPTRERVDVPQALYEGFIGAIVGGGTGALMQRASSAIEDVPELSPEAQQVYNQAEQAAITEGATPEAADIAGTKALGATEEGQAYIEATADAMDAVFRAEAAMGQLEEGGAILPTAKLTDEQFDDLFTPEATEEEIVAKLIADVEQAQPDEVEQAELQEALTGLQVARQEETATQIRERAEKIEADAISSLAALEAEQDPLPHLEAIGNLVFDEGATDIKTFSKRMQEKLGELWEQFKEFMQAIFDKLREQRGSIEFGRDETVKQRIRRLTGQTKGESALIREDEALKVSLKKQEQAAKKATKETRKEILAEIDTIKERRKTIKQQIKEFIGQVAEEPTVTERDALRRSLERQVTVALQARREGRQEAVAKAREQIDEIRGRIGQEKAKVAVERDTRKKVTQFIKDTIPLSEQGKFLKAVVNAHTPKQFGDIIERAQKFAEEFTEQDLKKRLRGKIKKELKTVAVKKKGGKPVGKFTPEAQKTLDLLRDAAKLSTEEAGAKVAANLALYPDTIPPDNVALENRVLSMVHGFDNRTSAELETLLQEIKEIKDTGKMINELRKFNRQAKIERVVGESVDVLSGGTGIPASISAGKQAAGIDISDRQSTFEKATQWLVSKDLWLQGWPDLFNKLSRLDPSISKPGELTNPLEEFADVTKEENAEKKGLRLNIIKIRDLFKKAYGIKVDTSRKSEREMLEKMREDTKIIDLGVYEDLDGKKIHLKFTRAQARKRFMEFQDPTLDQTFTEGMRYTEDMLIAITETLTAQDKTFAKSELEFYREYYEGVNSVYRDIYGVDLPFNEFYNPIRRELVKGQDDIVQTGGFGEFLQDLNTRGSVTSKSFISRVKNINPILQQSDVAVLEQHLAEMEKFKAWAKKIRDFNAVFGDVEFKTAVELYHGIGFLSTINNFVANYTRGGVNESGRLHWVDKIRGNIARSVLALKPVITIKQLISTIAYAESIPVAEFAKGEIDFWKNPVKNTRFIYKHSELMKSRGQNQERDLKTALKSDEFSAYRARPNFLNSLMLNIQLGDQGAIVVGGHAVIKYHMDKGKSIEEAIAIFERLTSSTQQSADISLLSTAQRGGSFAKMFTQFMSAPNLYYRREMWALRNLMHGKIDKKQFTKTIMLYHVLIPMIFQFISDGFTWDEDEQFRAFLLGPLNGVFIMGDMVDGIIRRALGLRRYDDEVPIMTIVDDTARGWDLWDWNNLTSEEFHNALRGLAGAVGKLKGIPLKTALDMGEGIDKVLTGKFEEGAIQTLGYSPSVAKKRTDKGGTF